MTDTFTRGQARRPVAAPPAPAPAKPGVRFTLQAVLDGFPLTVEFQGDAERLVRTVERLRAIGATPPREAL